MTHVGMGCALFEFTGDCLQPRALFAQHGHGKDNVEAELRAVLLALQRAVNDHWHSLIIESDCQPVVGWLRGTMALQGDDLRLRDLVTQCRNLHFPAQWWPDQLQVDLS